MILISKFLSERPWQIVAYKSGFNMDTFLSKFARDPKYGDEVNLRCDSGGIPVPTITWFKDRQRINTSAGKYYIKVSLIQASSAGSANSDYASS